MGIFSRVSDIITANLNSLLDRAENPEAMLAQVIREMADGRCRECDHARKRKPAHNRPTR